MDYAGDFFAFKAGECSPQLTAFALKGLFTPWGKRWITHPCQITRFNRWAPVWCFLTIIGTWWWGVTSVLPAVYRDMDEYWTTLSQMYAHIIGLEVTVNWLCLRYVESGYSPDFHVVETPQQALLQRQSTRLEEIITVDGPVVSTVLINNNTEKPSGVEAMEPKSSRSRNTVYVVSGFSSHTGFPRRTAFPYWSWVPCVICNHSRPPRCHHCSLCKKCVLKRDHHCFFAGSCIGYRNMRHFIVFCFWTSFGCIYAFVHSFIFYCYALYEQTTFLDLLPVVVHLRWIFGFTSGSVVQMISIMWSLIFFFPLATHFLYVNIDMVLQGQTSFERDNKIPVVDSRSTRGKFESVFGRYWYLNIVVPLHAVYPVIEDPLNWPTMKL